MGIGQRDWKEGWNDIVQGVKHSNFPLRKHISGT